MIGRQGLATFISALTNREDPHEGPPEPRQAPTAKLGKRCKKQKVIGYVKDSCANINKADPARDYIDAAGLEKYRGTCERQDGPRSIIARVSRARNRASFPLKR
jgi:hypothetical protein